MSNGFVNLPLSSSTWLDPVAAVINLPASGNRLGDTRLVTSTGTAYYWDGSAWQTLAGGGGGGSLTQAQFTNSGTVPLSVTAGVVTASLATGNLTSTSTPIVVTGGTGAVVGSGTSLALTTGNLSEATSSVLTITGGTGAQVGGATTIQVGQSTTSTSGYLSSTDWNTFNGKEPTVTKGNLTEATSSVLTFTGGTGAVIGAGTTVQVKQATTSVSGYLSSADWNTFTAKEPAITIGTSAQYYRGDKTMQTLNQAAVAGLTTADSPAFTSVSVAGTGGAGFLNLVGTATAPSTPASNNFRIFLTQAGNRLQIKDSGAVVESFAREETQKNFIINGGFDVAQRGGSASTTPYTVDRWAADNSLTAASWSQQPFTGGGSHPGNAKFNLRCAGDGVTSMRLVTAQGVESINTSKMRSRQISLTGYIRFSSATTSSSGALGTCTISVGYTTGTADAAFATTDYQANGVSAPLQTYSQGSLPTTWTLFTLNVLVSSAATNIGVRVSFANATTALTSDWYELSNVMLNIGRYPGLFTLSGGTEAGELAACQRYAEVGGGGCFGRVNSTTAVTLGWQYKATKRVTPTVSLLATNPTIIQIGVGSNTATGGALSGQAPTPSGTNGDINGFTGLVATNSCVLISDMLFASAEL